MTIAATTSSSVTSGEARPHPYSVVARKGCSAVDVRGLCQHEGGPRWLTAEAAVHGKRDGRGNNWHPTVGIQQLRGEALAWLYAHIVLDALSELRDAVESNQTAMLLEGKLTLPVSFSSDKRSN